MKSGRHGVKNLVTSMTRQCTRRHGGQWRRQEGLKVLRRWKDINKRDVEKPSYRSRVVAIEFNTSQMDGLFAATAPLEALRLLVSNAATVEKCPDSAFKEETKAITVNDVAIAFFEAFCCRRRLQSSCVKKTVWWGYCRNHCTVPERCSRELPERNSEIHEGSRSSFGRVQRKYIFPRSSRSESHGSQG